MGAGPLADTSNPGKVQTQHYIYCVKLLRLRGSLKVRRSHFLTILGKT